MSVSLAVVPADQQQDYHSVTHCLSVPVLNSSHGPGSGQLLLDDER